jgi:hypothetical protein
MLRRMSSRLSSFRLASAFMSLLALAPALLILLTKTHQLVKHNSSALRKVVAWENFRLQHQRREVARYFRIVRDHKFGELGPRARFFAAFWKLLSKPFLSLILDFLKTWAPHSNTLLQLKIELCSSCAAVGATPFSSAWWPHCARSSG